MSEEFKTYGYRIVHVKGHWRSKPKRKKRKRKKSTSSALSEIDEILEEGW